ncbi:MAG: hypothetical protein ABFD57_02545 [Smithella sp.]
MVVYFYEPGQARSEVIKNRGLYDLCVQARGYRFTGGNSLPDDFTGRAPFTYGNGDTYEDDWVNGNFKGRGTYTYANGDKYEGEFFDDRFTGKGTFTCANGKQFTGKLENKKPKELNERCN